MKKATMITATGIGVLFTAIMLIANLKSEPSLHAEQRVPTTNAVTMQIATAKSTSKPETTHTVQVTLTETTAETTSTTQTTEPITTTQTPTISSETTASTETDYTYDTKNEYEEYETEYTETYSNICPYTGYELKYSDLYYVTDDPLTSLKGVNEFYGRRETFYSENVLPGYGLDIPGRHTACDGTIRDADGYICVAAAESYMPYGSILLTSLGPAKVYDTGCAYGTIDIYTNW